jgi:hypothetical protein
MGLRALALEALALRARDLRARDLRGRGLGTLGPEWTRGGCGLVGLRPRSWPRC